MILGIDIGGHAIKAGLLDKDKLIQTYRTDIRGDEDVSTFLDKVKSTIEKFPISHIQSIGIGVPGIVDPHSGEVFDIQNISSLKKVALKEILEVTFNKSVFVNNDANCFALGENYFGLGTNYTHFLGVTLGTGLGTGIIINKQLYSGVFCGAGEIGMLPYKGGILEEYTGSFFFEKHKITGEEAYNKAMGNDQKTLTLFNEFGKHLGYAIQIMLHAYAPEAIVLGGAISKSFPFFESAMRLEVAKFPFKKQLSDFEIFVSQKNDMGILGAAALCLQSGNK
ncbi:ROK family protein [Flavobacteriaceae bacterium M23B6Z8]